MSSKTELFLSKWHKLVAEADTEELASVLSPDITMGAPPYWDKLEGHATVHHLLGIIIKTIEDFTYHREWHFDVKDAGEIALEFRGHVGDHQLQGIDLISLNDEGLVENIDVLIRPMNSLEALREVVAPQMMAYFQSLADDG